MNASRSGSNATHAAIVTMNADGGGLAELTSTGFEDDRHSPRTAVSWSTNAIVLPKNGILSGCRRHRPPAPDDEPV